MPTVNSQTGDANAICMAAPASTDDSAFEQATGWNSFAVALLRASRDCVKLIDLDGNVVAVNLAGLDVLQFESRGEVVGRAWETFWGEDEKRMVRDSVAAAVAGRSASFDAFCATAKGEPRWWQVTVEPIRDESGKVRRLLACSRDMTLQRQREGEMQAAIGNQRKALLSLSDQFEVGAQKLRDAEARSTHDEKLKFFGQFVGCVVHDFNNVFAAVHGAARMLRRRVTDPSALEIVAHLERAAERGSGLARQLLDFARDEGDASEVYDPGLTVSRDAHLLRHILAGQATLSVNVDPDVWPVLGSPTKLQSVVFNLVANARDATAQEGEVEIAVANCASSTRPQGLDASDYVHICVSDNGCGMSPEALKRAGEAFFTTKPKGKGTGLGLASAFEFAASSGGRVYVHSAPGEGTRISVYLRRSPVAGDAVTSADGEIDPALHGGAKLLVVDDDTMLRNHIATAFRALDYIVVEASTFEIAAATVEGEADFDLVVTDINLTDGLGDKLVERLRKKQPNLSAIYLTGSSSVHVARDETVLCKPVSESRLARIILQKLGRLPGCEATPAALRQVECIAGKLRDPELLRLLSSWRDFVEVSGRTPMLVDDGPWRDEPPLFGYVVSVGSGVEPELTFLRAGAGLSAKLGRDLIGTAIESGDEEILGGVAKASHPRLDGTPGYDYVCCAPGDGAVSTIERLSLPLADTQGRVKYLFGAVAFATTSQGAATGPEA